MSFSLCILCHNFPTVIAVFWRCLVRNLDRCLRKFRTKTIRREIFVLNRSKLSKEVSSPKPEYLLMQVLYLKGGKWDAGDLVLFYLLGLESLFSRGLHSTYLENCSRWASAFDCTSVKAGRALWDEGCSFHSKLLQKTEWNPEYLLGTYVENRVGTYQNLRRKLVRRC